jgi:hypothetical protein
MTGLKGVRNYCTYFDSGYLHRGLALLHSMRAHVSEPFRLHILAMDDSVLRFFSGRPSDDVRVVGLTELRAADPEFASVSDRRVGKEHFFSVTAPYCLWLMRLLEPSDTLTYLDADTLFFADPSFLHRELDEAEVAITPHRFGPRNIHRKIYGLFNVGWVTWRKSGEGLRCLEDYRRACLEWCHHYVDGTRFADQRYLDTWPRRYAGVRVIDHPGVNLAPWNLDASAVSGNPPRAAGREIVLYHFHGFRELPGGGFDSGLAAYQPVAEGHPEGGVQALYAHYYDLLCQLREVTAEGTASPPRPAPVETKGRDLARWEVVAEPATELGPDPWNEPSVVAELDRCLSESLRRVGTTQPISVVAWEELEVMTVASLLGQVGHDGPRMLEWGGGVGLLSVQLKRVLGPRVLAHDVVEVARVRERGQQHGHVNYVEPPLPADWGITSSRGVEPGGIRSSSAHGSSGGVTRGAPARAPYDLAVALNAIHFAADWRSVLEGLCDAAERIYLSRVPLVFSTPSFRFVHRFHDHPYGIAASAWAIELSELESTIARRGFVVERLGPPLGVRMCHGAPEAPETWSLTLRRDA